jgi:hypothetical protein
LHYPEIAYNYLMNDPITIRPATVSDHPVLRRAIIELQDHERRLHATRLPGEQIADTYLAWIEHRAADCGAVLVAEMQGIFVGFAAGWVEQDDNIAETADSNRFGYISDICPPIAASASRFDCPTTSNCISAGPGSRAFGSLPVPQTQRRTYERGGFVPYEIVYEKPTGGGAA